VVSYSSSVVYGPVSNFSARRQMVAQLQNVKELESAGFFPKDERPVTDAFYGDEVEGRDALGNTIKRASVIGNVDERHVSQLTEFAWLMRREAISMKRDKMFLIARFMQATMMSLLIGLIFLFVGERDPNQPVVSTEYLLLSLSMFHGFSLTLSTVCRCFKVSLVQ